MIQSLWIGKRLSTMERLSLASFLQHGHTVHLYAYDQVDGVPKGTVLKDAGEVIAPDKIFRYRDHDSFAGFSNLFRYKLLLERGGYWVDTDVVCLKPFRFERDHMFASVPGRRRAANCFRRRQVVPSWFLKAPAGSEVMEYCYREAAGRDPRELGWGEIGTRLVRAAVGRFEMQGNIAPPHAFFPLHARQWRQLISGSFIAVRRWRGALHESSAIHLYNEMWRRGRADKDATYPRDCIYEQLKRRYLG